ncbi:MAG TPA: DUF885 domain-containing protein [Allosphingosinicella sp.]|nr:DUF885 domain-containing protein [Allosphingosinicella sp.]
MDLGATRRELLAGLGALALAPAPADRQAGLRSLLDRAAAAAQPEAMRAVIRRAPVDGLDRAERALLRMVDRGLERDMALRRAFPFGKADGSSPYVLSHRHGAYLELGAAGPSPADKARRLDDETERLRAEAGRGIAPPAFLIDSIVRTQAADQANAAFEVQAALGRQMKALGWVRARAAAEPGVWSLPGGEDYYRLRLRCTSGLDDPPERIEQRSAEETAALLERADGLLRGLGLVRGSVGERLRSLKRRPGNRFSNDEAGRSRAVMSMNSALARLRPNLGAWFNPPLETGGSVRRMTAAEEGAGKRGYRDPAAGVYYPDLSAVDERPAWTLPVVACHETFPGHLLQLGRQARADPHPLQVKYAPGYSEGWAIYAEALVDGAGLLSPLEQLGYLQSRLFRLARVTCDIGIHLRRWSRARAVHHLEEIVGFELFFPFAVEVDRYSAEPGAFAGDAMVALTLGRLGRQAAASGRAGLRAFHDRVLDPGPLSAEAVGRIM